MIVFDSFLITRYVAAITWLVLGVGFAVLGSPLILVIGMGFEERAGVPVMAHPDHTIPEDFCPLERMRQDVEEMYPCRVLLLDLR